MDLSYDDARSDFILAAAAAIFGSLGFEFLLRIVGGWLPEGPIWSSLLRGVMLFVITGLVPLLLNRYRKLGRAGFGLEGSPSGIVAGLVLILPFTLVAIIVAATHGGAAGRASIGLLSLLGPDVESLAAFVELALTFLGSLLLVSFLTVRARDGFRQTEVSQLEALRTYGAGAAAGALLLALLIAIGTRPDPDILLLQAVGAFALVLVADRLVAANTRTTRATILAPAIVTLVSWVVPFGDLLGSLFLALIAGAATVVVAVLIETRQRAWAIVPLVAATVIYAGISAVPLVNAL